MENDESIVINVPVCGCTGSYLERTGGVHLPGCEYSVTRMSTEQWDELLHTLNEPDNAPALERYLREERRFRRSPCPCVCNSGGFCGGCGHAGCGGRR